MLEPEHWMPIPHYGGFYEVSDLGRVRSVGRVVERKYSNGTKRFQHRNGRILRTAPVGRGYLAVSLYRDDIQKKRTVHQLVLLAFAGPPDGLITRHLNGDRTDNRLKNLKYGTGSENLSDSVRHGTHPMARKTRCAQNHEYTPENTYRSQDGHRGCRTCHWLRNS